MMLLGVRQLCGVGGHHVAGEGDLPLQSVVAVAPELLSRPVLAASTAKRLLHTERVLIVIVTDKLAHRPVTLDFEQGESNRFLECKYPCPKLQNIIVRESYNKE